LFGVGNEAEEINAKKWLISEIIKAKDDISYYSKKELELIKLIICKYEIDEKEIKHRGR